MANGLFDMFQPQDPLGQPTSFGNALADRSNSLVGMGMGLLSPYMAYKGESPYTKALEGYQAGSQIDTSAATRRAQLDLQRQQLARQNEALNLTDDIKEFNFARQKGSYGGSFVDWMKQKQQLQNKAGLQPYYYYAPDPDNPGKMKLGVAQLQSGGGATPITGLPEGAVPADPLQYLNTGSGFVAAPKRAPAGGAPATGGAAPGAAPGADLTSPTPFSQNAPSNFIPIDKRTPAREAELGKDEARAITQLPAIESNTGRAIARLNELEQHPGLDAATGFIMGKVPFAVTPAARDATARIQEIQSETWTQAVQDLRGLGALSNAEGSRIENARSRLAARDVSTADYRKALADLKDVLQAGLRNARLIASGKMKPYAGDVSAPAGSTTQNWIRDQNGNLVRQ